MAGERLRVEKAVRQLTEGHPAVGGGRAVGGQ